MPIRCRNFLNGSSVPLSSTNSSFQPRAGVIIPCIDKRFIRTNDRIRAREIRVIDDEGEQMGIMTPYDALKKAREKNLDLVEISPTAQPPVCRIMDYGKYLSTIFFRGREMTRTSLGRQILERLIKDVQEESIVEFRPRQEGNTLHAILAPKKSAQEREKEKEKEAKQKAKQERMQKEKLQAQEKEKQPAQAAVAAQAPNPTSQA